MKVTLDKTVLSAALARCAPAARVVGRDGGFVRLAVYARSLTVAGYDGDLFISVCIEDVDGEEGTCLWPSRLGAHVLGALGSGSVTVAALQGGVALEGGSAYLELATPPEDAFLPFPLITGVPQEVEASAFCDALGQVVYAASTDLARPLLTGVLLQAAEDGVRLVATDSYRLVVRDVPGVSLAFSEGIVLPARALSAAVQAYGTSDGVLTICCSDDLVSFAANGTVVATRLINGQYPDYARLLPPASQTVLVSDVEPAVEALKRMELIRGNGVGPTVLEIDATGVQLSTRASERGMARERLDGKTEGKPLTVGCNPTFLAEAIHHTGGEQFALMCVDALKPIKVTGTHDDRYLALVMPVRMD